MLTPVRITACGLYHPYRYLGNKNPRNDVLSRKMMDFKDETNTNHKRAVHHFSQLAIDQIGRMDRIGHGRRFYEFPFYIVIVPSHTSGRISPALIDVAKQIIRAYPKATLNNCLIRTRTIPSVHREGGDRSIVGHMSSISSQNYNLHGTNVLLLDDVKTTGGSISACYYLLESAGAGIIIPIALLETANYEK